MFQNNLGLIKDLNITNKNCLISICLWELFMLQKPKQNIPFYDEISVKFDFQAILESLELTGWNCWISSADWLHDVWLMPVQVRWAWLVSLWHCSNWLNSLSSILQLILNCHLVDQDIRTQVVGVQVRVVLILQWWQQMSSAICSECHQLKFELKILNKFISYWKIFYNRI